MHDLNKEIARQLLLFMSSTGKWLKRHIGGPHLANSGFSEAQFRILFILKHKQPLKMSDLSNFCRVTKGSATITLSKLVEEGYVERFPKHGDRRVVLVKLTPKGEECLREAWELGIIRVGEALSGMAEEKKRKLLELLTELRGLFDYEEKPKTD